MVELKKETMSQRNIKPVINSELYYVPLTTFTPAIDRIPTYLYRHFA